MAAVGVIGDICRAISKQILPHCDELMYLLLEDLANESVHRSVKPHILSVFGDIALAVGTDFTKYLDVILKTLQQASQANVDKVCVVCACACMCVCSCVCVCVCVCVCSCMLVRASVEHMFV